MKIVISNDVTLNLTKQKARDFANEMKYACREVSVFPVMEEILGLMEAGQ